MRSIVVLALALAACSDPEPYPTLSENTGDMVVVQDHVIPAYKPVEPKMKEVMYWPQPDFDSERVFKSEDQYGCWWWVEAHSKFDDTWIVLKDGKPDCLDPKYAPAPVKGLVPVDEAAS